MCKILGEKYFFTGFMMIIRISVENLKNRLCKMKQNIYNIQKNNTDRWYSLIDVSKWHHW